MLTGGGTVRDAMGDGPGLARAGSREHHDRPVQGLGDRALLVVEPGEDVGAGSHGLMLACRPDEAYRRLLAGLPSWKVLPYAGRMSIRRVTAGLAALAVAAVRIVDGRAARQRRQCIA